MDFFSSTSSMRSLPQETPITDDPFAEAIRRRFNSVNGGLLTANLPILSPEVLSPVSSNIQEDMSPLVPSSPMQKLSLKSAYPLLSSGSPQPPLVAPLFRLPAAINPQLQTPFLSIPPEELPKHIADPDTLLIDIRQPSAFDSSHLTTAISLSVPSTFLRRPAFTLSKISTLLSSQHAKMRFERWPSASRIIAIDNDTTVLSESSNISGLLRKFVAEHYEGPLLWVPGGFSAVTRGALSLSSLSELLTSGSSASLDEITTSQGYQLPRARDLPHSAFEQGSTTIAGQRPIGSMASSASTHAPLTAGSAPGPTTTRVVAANPFYDNIRQMAELSHGVTERIPLILRPEVRARVADLPFPWLREMASRSETDGADIMAMQFYKIELAEQRRMMGIMEEHSKQSQADAQSNATYFPFSITAGVEKGTKNRYRNIWPFEHARVHLQNTGEDGSDYVNASYVQPVGTTKRYIATQGPLPTTIDDFWRLVWEQKSHVIVMLTKRFEGSSVKCGTYWPTEVGMKQQYGSYVVEATSACDDASEDDTQPLTHDATAGFDFNNADNQHSTSQKSKAFARRTFLLSDPSNPEQPSREISHFQFLEWPDLDVPSSTLSLLEFLREVNDVCRDDAPVVLHCSAGVGRTGGYILIDAVLSAIRSELRRSNQMTDAARQADAETYMDVDSQPSTHELLSSSEAEFDVLDESSRQSPDDELKGTPDDTMDSNFRPIIRRRRVSNRLQDAPSTVRNKGFFPNSELVALAMREAVPRAKLDLATPSHSPSVEAATSASFEPRSSLFSDATTHTTAVTSNNSSSAGSPSAVEKPTAFDFIPPRSLAAGKTSPPASLAAMEEPVRQVLDAMREQRMSLCQTLRQFVFAHKVIIEGALAIVDEEQTVHSPHEKQQDRRDSNTLNKRPSVKRRDRSDSSLEERVSRSSGRVSSLNKLLKSS